MQAYSDPSRESDPHALPDVEVFYITQAEADNLVAEAIVQGGHIDGERTSRARNEVTLMTLGRTRLAKLRKERHARAVAFFVEHAGYSYDPKTETAEQGKLRGAEALAQAEEYAHLMGWTYLWSDDWAVDHQKEFDIYKDGGPQSCEYCQLTNGEGRVLESLSCIDDATPSYRRVVEAELALQAMPS